MMASKAFSATFTIQPQTEAESKDVKIYTHAPDPLASDLNVVSPDLTSFHSMVQFDLPTLTAAQIKYASITLYCTQLGASGGPEVGGDVALRPILGPWRETSASPGAAPLGNYANILGGSPTIPYEPTPAAIRTVTGPGFYDWNVTELVKSWVSDTISNNGVLISLETPGGDIGFSDVDSYAALPASKPKITIIADVDGPTLPAIATRFLTADESGTAALPSLISGITVTDDFDQPAAITVMQSPAAGTPMPVGTSFVTVTATDSAGNSTTQDVAVRVRLAEADLVGDGTPSRSSLADLELPADFTLPAGTVIESFSSPAIADDGATVARVFLAQGKRKIPGIYLQAPGREMLVAAQGSSIDGLSFKSFLDPVISAGGKIAFGASIQGPGVTRTEDDSIWTDAFSGALQPILFEGSPIDGVNPGFAQPVLKSVTSISLKDDELVALVSLAPGKAGVAANNDVALLRITEPRKATVLLREGSRIPTSPIALNSPIKTIAVFRPAVGSPGQGRWHGGDSVIAKVTLADRSSHIVTVDHSRVATLLASTGQDAGGAGGAKWADFGLPALSGDGSKVAVLGTLARGAGGVTKTNDSYIAYKNGSASFVKVVQEGDEAPLAAVPAAGMPTFASFLDPVVNAAGTVAFKATLSGAGVSKVNKTGLWAGAAGNLKLIARTGEPATNAAGTPLGAGITWASIDRYALPDGAADGLIFVAKLKGAGVTNQNNIGIWIVDNDTPKLVLRTGMGGLHPTDNELILTGISLLQPTARSYSTARSYNSTGSVSLVGIFADKSQSILRIDLPF